MSSNQHSASPDRSTQKRAEAKGSQSINRDLDTATTANGHGEAASLADEPEPASIATEEWWNARLARQFGDGVLQARMDSRNDDVLILGRLGVQDLALLQDFIESSGQADRVRSLVEPV